MISFSYGEVWNYENVNYVNALSYPLAFLSLRFFFSVASCRRWYKIQHSHRLGDSVPVLVHILIIKTKIKIKTVHSCCHDIYLVDTMEWPTMGDIMVTNTLAVRFVALRCLHHWIRDSAFGGNKHYIFVFGKEGGFMISLHQIDILTFAQSVLNFRVG